MFCAPPNDIITLARRQPYYNNIIILYSVAGVPNLFRLADHIRNLCLYNFDEILHY